MLKAIRNKLSSSERKNNTGSSVISDMNIKQRKYDALVYSLHGDIFRYAYWLTRDRQVSEDLVQETFLRAWRSLDSLKDEKAAKAWLITILRRENARRFERKQLDLVDIDDHPVAAESNDHESDFETELLRRKIGELAPDYREPLLLQIIGGFSGDEIANILDINKNTVMTRLFRARNQLKEALTSDERMTGVNNG